MVLQEVVKIPKLVNFMGLDGKRVIQLPDNAKITVRSNGNKVYQCPITRKTKYNAKELMDRDNKFNANVDTDKWIVTAIIKETPHRESSLQEQKREYADLTGDY
jgi:hypothetical protein